MGKNKFRQWILLFVPTISVSTMEAQDNNNTALNIHQQSMAAIAAGWVKSSSITYYICYGIRLA